MRKMNFIAAIAIVLAMVPALALADSAESKRLFNQGQYAMGIMAAKGSIEDYNTAPEERAASYYWQGKNQIAKGDVVAGIYSMKLAIKTKSSVTYTDELAKIVNQYAGQSMKYYRACESMMSNQQKALARNQIRSAYLSQVKIFIGQKNITRAKSMAEKIHRFDSSVGPALARIFAQSALASNDPEYASNSAEIALGYSIGEDKALGQKFLAMSKQIERANGPFDARVDKFYQLAQKFDSSIPDNVIHCQQGEKIFIKIPPKGKFSPWYDFPNRRCNFEIFVKRGISPDFIVYFSEGQKIVKKYLGEDYPAEVDFSKIKFESVVDREIPIMIFVTEYNDKRMTSR